MSFSIFIFMYAFLTFAVTMITYATNQPSDRIVSVRIDVCQTSRFPIPSPHSSRVFGIWQQRSSQKVWPVGHRQAYREEQECKTGRCRTSADEETQPSTDAIQRIIYCSPSVTTETLFDRIASIGVGSQVQGWVSRV